MRNGLRIALVFAAAMFITCGLMPLCADAAKKQAAHAKPSAKPAKKRTPKSEPPKKEAAKEEVNGGLFMFINVAGTELTPDMAAFLKKRQPAGVILLGQNVSDKDQVRNLILQIKNAEGLGMGISDLPLIAIDQEGGDINRLRLKDSPTAEQLGLGKNPARAREVGRYYAHECRALGIAIIFAPVLDVYVPGANEFLKTRSFGGDPKTVAEIGLAFASGIREEGLLPVVKHFPGHGAAQQDSHKKLAVLPDNIDTVDNALLPFAAAAKVPGLGIMSGHIVCSRFDSADTPASLSEKMLTKLLRGEWGFKGPLFTDDLNMGAISAKTGLANATLKAIAAGNNFALLCIDDPAALNVVCAALGKAVQSGKLPSHCLLNTTAQLKAIQLLLK